MDKYDEQIALHDKREDLLNLLNEAVIRGIDVNSLVAETFFIIDGNVDSFMDIISDKKYDKLFNILYEEYPGNTSINKRILTSYRYIYRIFNECILFSKYYDDYIVEYFKFIKEQNLENNADSIQIFYMYTEDKEFTRYESDVLDVEQKWRDTL